MKTAIQILAILALAHLHATAALNPIEAELFPPDFLMAQRESLGLDQSQVQDMQNMVQEAQGKFAELKGGMDQRVAAVRDALKEPQVDLAKTEEKLRALFAMETEMKTQQFHLMLSLRNKLTPEQVEKARQLRQQQPPQSGDPRTGLIDRLQKKFEQLKETVQERASAGDPPTEIVAQAEEIQRMAQNGQPLEAEQKLDALIAKLRAEKAKR